MSAPDTRAASAKARRGTLGEAAGPEGTSDAWLPRPGDLVARKFRIERLLGRGGMGAVFVAQHELLQKRVALKLMVSDIAMHPEALPRFLNEARAAARVRGEHVAHVIDVGTLRRGVPYMVLEYLEGADLSCLLEAREKFPVDEAVDVVMQALEGLAQAHAIGVVHRDFKPSNLFVTRRADGSALVKVLDFGISKGGNADDNAREITRSNALLGTPPYASPEQLCDSKNVDVRTDVWSAGVVLFELLTGAVPFGGDSNAARIASTLEQAPAPLRSVLPGADPRLEAVLARCLAKDREDRFANVAELAEALVPFAPPAAEALVEQIRAALSLPAPAAVSVEGAPGGSCSEPRPRGARGGRAWRRWAVAGVVVVVVVAVGLRWGTGRQSDRAAVRAPGARTFVSGPPFARAEVARQDVAVDPSADEPPERPTAAPRASQEKRPPAPALAAPSSTTSVAKPAPGLDPAWVLGGRH